jgi:hypothetical protein
MAGDGDSISMFQVQQVIYRYFDCVNRADFDAIRPLFADNAVWEEPFYDLREESADSFVEFLRQSTATAALLVATPHCPAIELIGANAARATTTFHEFVLSIAPDDGPLGPQGTAINVQHYGLYYDNLALIDDSWKFTHRLAAVTYVEAGSTSGDVVADRASLLSQWTE